jgi:hypothetical protein
MAFAVQLAQADVAAMSRATKAMVLDASKFFNSVPFEEARAAFNEGGSARWHQEPYGVHMFAMYANGLVWADNVFSEFVGTDFSLVIGMDGFAVGRHILTQTAYKSEPLRTENMFISPKTGNETISVGHCMRPDPDHVLCSFSEQD